MVYIVGVKRKTLCRAKEVDTQQREKEKAMKKAYLNNMGTALISQGMIVLFLIFSGNGSSIPQNRRTKNDPETIATY